MKENDSTKLQIKGNNALAICWGFNYYLKYYCNSSVSWSGKNINIRKSDLPVVDKAVKIIANDYFRFYQNTCTYSYSFVWWNWDRWQYEIDWMALNGINLVYAHTAAEFAWIEVFTDLGLTRNEIDDFFSGPAYLAWYRFGNIQKFAGPLPNSWHLDQVALQKKILNRLTELGISYVLPAFSGFVPRNITRLYPNKTFTLASDWCNFDCNLTTCDLMVPPTDPLFTQIGQTYIETVIKTFGTAHFYSADVFNEIPPKNSSLQYLAQVNSAILKTMTNADEKAVWVMQAWLFLDPFWLPNRTEAFLSLIPKDRLILLDLFSESVPLFQNFESYYDHYFIWNMLHDFGGTNNIFGNVNNVNIVKFF
jgi:alpha-N-acetylglucosaminidase